MRLYVTCAIVVLLFVVVHDAEARKTSSSRRGSSGSSSYRSRTTSRPRGGSGGSEPGKIGWNVDKKPTNTNTAPKPSAPEPTIGKTSATNVQSSGYQPSGGYPRQPASNPYQPSSGQVYNSPSQNGYNPSGGVYNPHGQPYNPHGQPYNPHGQSNIPSYGQPYNPHGQPNIPSYGQPQIPSYGGGSPSQTILVQSQKPGLGQIAKEAFVFAGVSAGVNAAVNRILPGGIYGHRGSEGGTGGGTTHTEIHNNYYYGNNQTSDGASQPAAAQPAAPGVAAQPAAPGAAPAPEQPQSMPTNNASPPEAKRDAQNPQDSQNNPNPLGYITSDADIKKFTEELYEKDSNNAYKHITMNLQGQKKDESVTDDASQPLLDVKSEAYEIPTVKAVIALHDNYELDVKKKEEVTSEERREENELLDKFMETEIMKSARKFLSNKGYIPDDEYEFKDTLKRMWFSQFKRVDGEPSSSGFETVFLAERFDSEIIGMHSWIYFAKQESAKNVDYLGYIKETTLGSKGAIVKLRSKLGDIVQPVTTIFVGTSPELEMALYTMCFFTRPNSLCPISLGGKEFSIVANRVNYFGKDILISAYPDI